LWRELLLLAAALVLIVAGARLFTNGVEWVGQGLGLAEGAVGSVLAAVGTAAPESVVPLIAILFGSSRFSNEVGVGAILGAPFMLASLGIALNGAAVAYYHWRGRRGGTVTADRQVVQRDLRFFLIVFALAILASFTPSYYVKAVLALGLLAAYALFVRTALRPQTVTVRETEEAPLAGGMEPLLLAPLPRLPPGIWLSLAQAVFGLAVIVGGAKLFSETIAELSLALGVSAFVLSVIITPAATELPEVFNSVLWMGMRKDTLALGNVTGAMVFQSSVIPVVGILLTPWRLDALHLASAALAYLAVLLTYGAFSLRRPVTPAFLVLNGVFYVAFIYLILAGVFPV